MMYRSMSRARLNNHPWFKAKDHILFIFDRDSKFDNTRDTFEYNIQALAQGLIVDDRNLGFMDYMTTRPRSTITYTWNQDQDKYLIKDFIEEAL
jgi:hypothetical protein